MHYRGLRKISRHLSGTEMWHVGYNRKAKRYEFEKEMKRDRTTNYEPIADFNILEHNHRDIKWGLFVHLDKREKPQFVDNGYDQFDVPKGYWKILNDDEHQENIKSIAIKSNKSEMASVDHLKLIYPNCRIMNIQTNNI